MDRILMNYIQVSQHLSQQFRSHFGKLNLTFPQALALSVLGSEGPMPISKLAEKMGSANSTISGIVDRLERLELAKRTRSELDHRWRPPKSILNSATRLKRVLTSISAAFWIS